MMAGRDGRGGDPSGQVGGAGPGQHPSSDAIDSRREALGDRPARRPRNARGPADLAGRTPLLAAHQHVDRIAHPHPGAVQQHALVLGADAKQRASRLGVVALDIAQDDDGPLPGRQAVDRRLHVVPKLAARDQPFRIQLVPRTRHLQPVAVGGEPGGIGRRVLLGGQGDKADFTAPPGAGAIEHDRKQPGADRGAALEAADTGKDGEPGVLHNLLGLGVAADHRSGHAHEGTMEAADQPAIGIGLAAPQALDEGRIVEFGAAWWHDSDYRRARGKRGAWSDEGTGCNETPPKAV